jgi:hypothetical protein
MDNKILNIASWITIIVGMAVCGYSFVNNNVLTFLEGGGAFMVGVAMLALQKEEKKFDSKQK